MSRNDDYTAVNISHFLYQQNFINLLVLIYQDKQIRVFLSKLISHKN